MVHTLKYTTSGIIAGLLLMAGCERAPLEPENGPEATLTSIQANIFDVSCAVSGCHAGPAAPHALDLSQGQSHGNLVNVRSEQVPDLFRMQPGNPSDSYLIIKLEGGGRMAPGTSRMPLGRAPLSESQMNVIRQWISDGAPAN